MSLALTDVVLTYPDGDRTLTALDRVNLAVGPGEFAAVAGPSGSGKSSLLAVAATLVTPGSGTVSVAGRDTAGLRPAERTRLRRDHIGIVFQQPNLPASLTALDQLTVMAHMAGRSPRRAAGRARALLAAVDLAGLEHKRPHQMSGGERQRVNIARALMNGPEVLLVDEPTSALDHVRGEQVVTLLDRLTRDRGLATVMVTHDLARLAAADRVYSMTDGRLSEGAPAGGQPR
ncbi:putative ABC transport system ATP-binding protein [Actinomadura coerulea]|uniref:Putative ABC transport system ATP-binding protein n=1 Tax=Actinomadura coerulea TaxID=46159 RepID=A0A7X0L2B3_9ACTN|nr:ABC transporter ATP-binding protein [Actinomadura coerulea]MBB6399405.1 putative ABC transport system ATP-binding protein [Actinomadura coerulea]GGQ28670.1 ABC transporter ATP-binding protein [Actinomadura coerulea]